MKRLATLLLLMPAACSAPPALRPELQVERSPDPVAERSLEHHLWESNQPHGEGRLREMSWIVVPEPQFKKPDYGLYANPIP